MNDLQTKAQKLGIIMPEISSEQINDQIKPVLRQMEEVGIGLNCAGLNNLADKLTIRLKELEGQIYQAVGAEFNISSPIQMAEMLFDRLKLPTTGLKRTKSGVSTAASELSKISSEHIVIALILEYRELSKLISTYLRPLPLLVDENSRLHTTYSMDTSTGRLSSSEPNLQNIPIKGTYGEDIRAAFVASPGCKLIVADYSQIELRIVACLAKDKAMIEAFGRDEDIHAQTAAAIFNINMADVTAAERRVAKAVNFGIVYGQTPYGLSQALGIEVTAAATYIKNYFDLHTGIMDYINDMISAAHTDGYVETIFGTRRYLPNINSSVRYIAEGEERMAINMPVQGTAAEILKLAMIEMSKRLELINDKRKNKGHDCPARMLLTVHDEIVLEAPVEMAEEVGKILKDTMENVIIMCVPIKVSLGIGDNWAKAK
ncbi:MAG: DNA polymerase [bacterium]